MSEIPDDKKCLFKGMLMAIVTGFILVSLMPGTRARYFVPLVSISCILAGLLLSSITMKTTFQNLWKNTLLIFSLLLTFSLAAGIFLVNMRYIVNVFELFKVKTTTALELSPFIPAFGTAAVTIGVLIFIYRVRGKYCDSVALSVLTGLLVAVFSLQFSSFALPVMKQLEIKRPVGTAINKFLPQKEPVYLFNFGISNYQSFIYYIRAPVKYIFQDDEITDKVNYVLFDLDSYDRKLLEPGTFKRRPVVLTTVTLKKNKFILVQFLPSSPDMK